MAVVNTLKLNNPQITVELLTEVLAETNGMLNTATKILKEKHAIGVSSKTLVKYIDLWGMQEWIEDMRSSIVEDCFNKTYMKGLVEGDNQCLFWVLDRYGHHLKFLERNDVQTESRKGWKEILERVKEPPK